MLSMLDVYRELNIIVAQGCPDPEVVFCLERAVIQGRPDCIRGILSLFPENDIPEILGYFHNSTTPLATAVSLGKAYCVIALLERCPEQHRPSVIKRAVNRSTTLLALAVGMGHPDMIKLLLAMCPAADRLDLMNWGNLHSITPLMVVVGKKDLKVLDNLLQAWPEEQRKQLINPPLMLAAQTGQENAVRMLLRASPLEQRASMITQQQRNGQTALSIANKKNDLGCILTMFENCPPEQHLFIHQCLEMHRGKKGEEEMVDEEAVDIAEMLGLDTVQAERALPHKHQGKGAASQEESWSPRKRMSY